MIRLLPYLAALLLIGCGQPEQAAAPSNDTAQAAPAPKAPVPALKGEWRVAAITGAPVTGTPMTMTIAGGSAKLTVGCIRRTSTFTQDRNTVDFAFPSTTAGDCARLPSAQEDLMFVALGDANVAIFDQDGREVTLSGTGGTVTLERR